MWKVNSKSSPSHGIFQFQYKQKKNMLVRSGSRLQIKYIALMDFDVLSMVHKQLKCGFSSSTCCTNTAIFSISLLQSVSARLRKMSEVKFQFWNIKLNGCYNMCAKSNQVIIYEYMTERMDRRSRRGRIVLYRHDFIVSSMNYHSSNGMTARNTKWSIPISFSFLLSHLWQRLKEKPFPKEIY